MTATTLIEPSFAPWTRRRLRHLDHAEAVQHIVFRLADSLPAALLRKVHGRDAREGVRAVEWCLDRAFGSRALADPAAASVVVEALRRFDGERYRLRAWCVMPTHVHVLADQIKGWSLADVVHGWKSTSAHRIGRAPESRGRFWAPNYFDRYMRDDSHLNATRTYIQNNPVKARLCAAVADWPWSSAATECSHFTR